MPDFRIQALAKRIAETRPIERSKRQALLEELRQLRGEVDPRAAHEQVHRLDAALLLMEFMSRAEELATADALRTVSGLVGSVDERALRPRAPRPADPGAGGRTPADVSEHGDLRMSAQFLLGSILAQAGVISQENLARALRLHASSGVALGQCLIQLGAATPDQIASAVAYQERTREFQRAQPPPPVEEQPPPSAQPPPSERPPPSSAKLELRLTTRVKGFVQSFQTQMLGEILVRLGTITREQLERALQVQRAASVHIGEALVQTGATNWEHVKKALEIQRQLRRNAA